MFGYNTWLTECVFEWYKSFWGHKVVKNDSTSGRLNKQEWDQRQACKAVDIWRSLVDCSNDRKSAGLCLEDYRACRKSVKKWCQEYWMMIISSAIYGSVRTSLRFFKLNETCFVESSQVIRHGFLSMIRKPSTRAIIRCLRGCRKQDSQKSKSCWSCFSMWEALSTTNSWHNARRSISNSIKWSWDVCFAQCAIRNEIYSRINHGCFTTTMHLLATPWAIQASPY